MFEEYGYTPTLKSIYEDPIMLEKYPYIIELYKALKVGRMRPETPVYAQLSDVLQRNLSESLTQELTAKISMKNATSTSEQIMLAAGGLMK